MKGFIYVVSILLWSAVCITGISAAGESTTTVSGKAYYDTATGHKYIQNDDLTYTEFSKRGKILRENVPNTTPLLVSGKYIIEVKPDHYLVYERRDNTRVIQQVRPASERHPEGWHCKQLVSAVNQTGAPTAEGYQPVD